MTGFHCFDSPEGVRFGFLNPEGERLCLSDAFGAPSDRDGAISQIVRTIVAQHLCSAVPADGSVILIRYDDAVSLPSQFMLGWASALRSHLEITYGKRVSVLFAPREIGLECFSDGDLAALGLMRVPATSAQEAE
jgi:hypothetical protein